MKDPKTKLKTVRFASDDNVEIFTTEEPVSPLWFTPEELVGLRSQAKQDAENLKTKGYGILLKNCFNENDKRAQKHINAFAKLPGRECPRGTETYLLEQHRDHLDRIHSLVVKGVLNRQRLLREKDTPKEEAPGKLRSISRKHSKTSRLLARRLGLADQRAVREGDDLFTSQGLIRELNQGNAKMATRKLSSASLSDEKVGVTQLAGLAYMASKIGRPSDRINQAFPSPLPPSDKNHCGPKNTFSNVIRDALDLLDDDMDVSFEAPAFTLAKSA